MDIYSIGEMVIDFIPGEKEGEYIRNAGGAPANVAIAAARNGLEAGGAAWSEMTTSDVFWWIH